MGWNFNPYMSIASYVTGGGRDDVWVERGLSSKTRSKSLDNAMQLIFGRTFEGWTGPGRNYYELHQEYAQLSEIHWRPKSDPTAVSMNLAILNLWFPLPRAKTKEVP